MLAAMRALLVFAVLALPLHARPITEYSDVPPDNPSVDKGIKTLSAAINPLEAEAFDSPAQAAMKKLVAPETHSRPLRVANAEKIHPDLVTRLEEIRVYGRNEPEDYVGKKTSPMMQFRARLEKDVRLSPAKKVQLALCLIGLCSIYGPDGIPVGDSPEARADARLYQSTTQLNAQFRGTLQ